MVPQYDRTIMEEMTDIKTEPYAPIFSIFLKKNNNNNTNDDYDDTELAKIIKQHPPINHLYRDIFFDTLSNLESNYRLLCDDDDNEYYTIVQTWLKDTFQLSFSNVTFLYIHEQQLLSLSSSSSSSPPPRPPNNETTTTTTMTEEEEEEVSLRIRRELLQKMKDIAIQFEFVPYPMVHDIDYLTMILKHHDFKTIKNLISNSKKKKDIVYAITDRLLFFSGKRHDMDVAFQIVVAIFSGFFGMSMLILAMTSFMASFYKNHLQQQQPPPPTSSSSSGSDNDE